MGSSRWSDDHYADHAKARMYSGVTASGTTAYTHSLRSAPVSSHKVHDKMDPKGVKFRESRDSDAHPETIAIAVWFDVTGSMGGIPVTLQNKLSGLMAMLLKKGYVDHPQILFGAVGDATCDRVPLQVGQFESGVEMDDDLNNLYIEGGGGGHDTESYELAAYFSAKHFSADCYEKRNKKGYIFFIGDERPYDYVHKEQVLDLIGDTLQSDVRTDKVFEELKQKYEVFCLIPSGASNSGDKSILEAWRGLLGQNVITLTDPNLVCETIAIQIGICEERTDLENGIVALKDMGISDPDAAKVGSALAPIAKDRGSKLATASASGTLAEPSDSGSVQRL